MRLTEDLLQLPVEAANELVGTLSLVVVVGIAVGYLAYRVVYVVEQAVAGGIRTATGTLATAPGVRNAPTHLVFTSRYRLRAGALYALLAVGNAVAVFGLVLGAEAGRPRFFGMAVIAAVAMLVLDAVVVRPFEAVGSGFVEDTEWVWLTVRDQRFALAALLCSVGVVFVSGHGIVFFLLMAVFLTSVVLHAYIDGSRTFVPSSLALLAAGAGVTLAAQVLMVPYYMRTLDTVYHTALARRITTLGSLSATAGTRYADLPVYHTLASVATQATGLAPRTVAGVLFAVLFAVAVVACFAVVRNLTGSNTVGLIGAALLAGNPAFVAWGSQSHVQSLSFFFLAVFLVLLSKFARDPRYTLASVIVTLAWTLTHHLSVFMSITLIAVWVLAGTFWILVANRGQLEAIRRPVYQYMILTVSVSVYWYLSDLIWIPVNWITEHSTAASSGLPTEQFLIQTYSDPVALALASASFLLNNLHYAFLLALCGYGFWTVVRPDGTVPSRAFPKVIVGALVAIPLYVPNPTWMAARGLAALNRWGIMAILFALPVAALGIGRFANGSIRLPDRSRRYSGVLAVVAVVGLMAFFSLGGAFTDPSLAGTVGEEDGARKALSASTIDAGDHVLAYTDDAAVYTSHGLSGYLTHESWNATQRERSERFEVVSVVDGRVVAEEGLTIVEAESLRRSNVKFAQTPSKSDVYDGNVSILAPVSTDTVELDPQRRNVVYDNDDTYVTFEPAGRNGTAPS